MSKSIKSAKVISTKKIGKFTLTEYESFDDVVCVVSTPEGYEYVYCSFADAIAHECEWFDAPVDEPF
jgi:hypothetical protein